MTFSSTDGVRGRRRPRSSAGFTLLEILVALAIIVTLVAVVGLSVRSADRGLQVDAERLALLLSLAREEAQVRGTQIRFEADDLGYRFMIRRGMRWEPLLDDTDLREREWSARTELSLSSDDGRKSIEFGRDMVDAPFELALRQGDGQMHIQANGLGVFEVRHE
ncbi:MAG: GspH/FimT family pseudopilin [Burkholderiaceae bacterium]